MKLKLALCCGAAAFSSVADAATINLIDIGGVSGSRAEQGFRIAAAYWSDMLTNDVTIDLAVRFAALNPGIIGSTGSSRNDVSTARWASAVNSTKSNSTLDRNIVLPTLTNGGASFITNGVLANGNDDLTTQRYVDGTTTSSQTLYLNTSLTKALGLTPAYVPAQNPNRYDGTVTFSSNFGFDFDPTDGISDNTFDFIGVAIHEIGHALGFVSGVDFLDIYGVGPGNSPNEGTLGYSLNDTSIYSALDMFRYSRDPNNIASGSGPSLDLAVGGTKYFSIDGGQTALFDNTMSTGRFNGDGQQASHFKDTPGCQIGNGIMDPTFCFGQTGFVTGLDLAAYDAMGWNTRRDALRYQTTSTAFIYQRFLAAASVPEPATWGMMVLGFGLVGAGLRRRGPVAAAA
jgi:hypothetical protein